MADCSKPLVDMMTNNLMDWIPCSYAVQGPGFYGVGMLLWFTVFVMLTNTSEGYRMPLVWTLIFAPFIFAVVPGVLVNRLAGVLILLVAAAYYIIWQTFRGN